MPLNLLYCDMNKLYIHNFQGKFWESTTFMAIRIREHTNSLQGFAIHVYGSQSCCQKSYR